MNWQGDDDNRLAKGIIALVIISIALGLLEMGNILAIALILGGIAMLAGMFNTGRSTRSSERRRHYENRTTAARTRSGDRSSGRPSSGRAARPSGMMHRVANNAVRQAGHDPETLAVVPVDVGLLAYSGDDDPTLYRETHLPDDSDFVRPFAVLRCPRRAQGKVRFELVDEHGIRRYIDETPWELKKGETFIYPETWLPMRNVDTIDGAWKLRIYAAGMLLASHTFEWRDTGGGLFRAYLTGDGEITDDLQQELSRARLGRLSLEDLLEDQEGGLVESDEDAEAAARRAAILNRQQSRRR